MSWTHKHACEIREELNSFAEKIRSGACTSTLQKESQDLCRLDEAIPCPKCGNTPILSFVSLGGHGTGGGFELWCCNMQTYTGMSGVHPVDAWNDFIRCAQK